MKANMLKYVYCSLLNEIQIDEAILARMNIDLENRAHYKLLRFPKGFSKMFSLLVVFFIPLIFMLLCIRIAIKVSVKKYSDVNSIQSLVFSGRQKDIIKCYYPHINSTHVDDCFIGGFNLIKVYFSSVVVAYKLLSKLNLKDCIHLIHVFELVLFFDFLEKTELAPNILICSHYDRWATMLSCMVGNSYIVLQHGSVIKSYKPKVPITPPSKLIALSYPQSVIFEQNIYSCSVKEVVVNAGELDFDSKTNCDVIIINNPIYTEIEIQLYENLRAKGINVFFRPHPIIVNKFIDKEITLSLGNKVPKAKVFICIDSTLGFLYEQAGIPGVWWNAKDSIAYVVSQVEACLD